MRMAICDDDWNMRQTLQALVDGAFVDVQAQVDGFSSGEALLEAASKQVRPYALIVLNLEMFGSDGIQTARRVRALLPDCYLVAITSGKDAARAEGAVAAFRYLERPLSPQALAEAIGAVCAELADNCTLHTEDGSNAALVCVRDVLYAEAQDKRLRLVLAHQEVHDQRSLDELAACLQCETFCRVHRGYLVNLRYVASVDGKSLRMVNGDTIPLGRLRRKALAKAFQAYIKRPAR